MRLVRVAAARSTLTRTCVRTMFSSGSLDYSRDDTWFKRDAGSHDVDLFYVHPTTGIGLLSSNLSPTRGRKVLKDGMSGDPNLLENHCGAFGECNVWAPMYNQAGMLSQACKNPDMQTAKAEEKFIKPLLVAYADVKRAFEAFLDQRPDKARPFIVAGHSQGSIILSKVLRQCIAGSECEAYFVAGYLAGGYIPLGEWLSGFHPAPRASSHPSLYQCDLHLAEGRLCGSPAPLFQTCSRAALARSTTAPDPRTSGASSRTTRGSPTSSCPPRSTS